LPILVRGILWQVEWGAGNRNQQLDFVKSIFKAERSSTAAMYSLSVPEVAFVFYFLVELIRISLAITNNGFVLP
jgi:hypothetical protein